MEVKITLTDDYFKAVAELFYTSSASSSLSLKLVGDSVGGLLFTERGVRELKHAVDMYLSREPYMPTAEF